MLAAVLLVATLAVAPYVRSTVGQQAELAELEADVVAREGSVADLEAELERWDDPAFVTAQARERLFMVMPGEIGYVVLDPPEEEEAAPEGPVAAVRAAREAATGDETWFGTVWESVRIAGAPAPPPSP